MKTVFRKNFICLIIVLLGLIFYFNSNSTSFTTELISNGINSVNKIEVSFFVPFKSPNFVIKSEEKINSIIKVLDDLHLLASDWDDISYNHEPLQSYQMILHDTNSNHSIFVKIYANKYVLIDNKEYRILFKGDLSQIYDIIITEPQEKKIDEFYYNIKK